jgi:hypothetical protein
MVPGKNDLISRSCPFSIVSHANCKPTLTQALIIIKWLSFFIF